MQRSLALLITVLCTVVLTACQSGAETPAPVPSAAANPTTESTPAPDDGFIVTPMLPDSESGVLRGRVLSITTSEPISNTVVGLAQVTRQGEEGAFVYNTASSPMNLTDIDGFFIITNIPPAEYVLVVGDPYERNEIIKNPETLEAQTYFVEKGSVTEVGELKVDIGK